MSLSIKHLLLLLILVNAYLINKNKMTNTTTIETNPITPGSMVLQYLVREPKIITGKKKAIILLHGVGSNESDLFSFADQLPGDFYVIAARGQFSLGEGRYAWYNVDFSTGKPVFDKTQELSSREVIRKFITQVKQQYQLDEVYLGGFSQGAIMSFSVGLTSPREVKGIISLSGRVLVELKPLITKHEDLQKLRAFVAHGTNDNTLSVEYARDARSYLESLGVQLSYHEYDLGHQVNEQVIKDLNDWLDTK
jgi:phospholipase/carboxylesterase